MHNEVVTSSVLKTPINMSSTSYYTGLLNSSREYGNSLSCLFAWHKQKYFSLGWGESNAYGNVGSVN